MRLRKDRAEIRKQQAIYRQEAYNKLTVEEKLKMAMTTGGSKRQVARLKKALG